MDHDAFGFNFLVRRGDSKQLSCVQAAAHDLADHELALRDLHPNLVARAQSRDTKEFGAPLQSLTVEADAGMQRIVRDAALSNVVVEDAPIARLVTSIARM